MDSVARNRLMRWTGKAITIFYLRLLAASDYSLRGISTARSLIAVDYFHKAFRPEVAGAPISRAQQRRLSEVAEK
jgi:hypothetical protein